MLRARAYRLLSRLYLHGLTPEVLPVVRAVDDLAEHVPEPFGPDEAAAEHHRLFRREVYPYASVFLDREGRLGGRVSEAAAWWRAAAGLERRPRGEAAGRGRTSGNEAPDHLGHELELLARLPEAEGARFIDGHLLWWLPPFAHAVERHGTPFWREVAELTMEAVLDHRAAVGERSPERDDAPPVGFSAPPTGASAPPTGTSAPPAGLSHPPADPLDDPDAGLAEVAAFLASPPRSGLYLALGDLRALGRAGGVPGGFGDRRVVLTNLLRTAVGLDALSDLLEALRGLVEGHVRALDALGATLPGEGRFTTPWSERLEVSAAVLDRLAAADADAGRRPPSSSPPGTRPSEGRST